jgi:sigma-E factor negative regulatory protein RseB
MFAATKTLNYDGTFVYSHGDSLDSMRIIHKVDNGREFERVLSLTGAAREVVRDNRVTTCIFPDNRAVMVARSRPNQFFSSAWPETVDRIANSYTLAVLSSDRVAGRETWVVGISPKHQDRYGYQLWIDRTWYLLLKSTVIDTNGKPLEQVLFTDIKLTDHIPDTLLKPAVDGRGYTWYINESQSESQAGPGKSRWTVGSLPKGFAMREYGIQAMSASRTPVDHMVFSDGLATVSVFVEELEGLDDSKEGHRSMGAVNAYSTLVNGYQVTVVGELPLVGVQRIATSVTHLFSGP